MIAAHVGGWGGRGLFRAVTGETAFIKSVLLSYAPQAEGVLNGPELFKNCCLRCPLQRLKRRDRCCKNVDIDK